MQLTSVERCHLLGLSLLAALLAAPACCFVALLATSFAPCGACPHVFCAVPTRRAAMPHVGDQQHGTLHASLLSLCFLW
jgi:hypothetical protein